MSSRDMPMPRWRDIVMCMDGTWQTAASRTNVARFHDLVGPDAVRYYDPGVGTGKLDRVRGGVMGVGLADNVQEAYGWLCREYRNGDRLYLIGFSRGAFTARSLAGLIASQGIVPDYAARDAWRRYRDGRRGGGGYVDFVGVWDTVGALGVPVDGLRWLSAWRHKFHDTKLSSSIGRAHQALALDERRAPFAPALWTSAPRDDQTVEQVWFPGCHGDVGGGMPDGTLSEICLAWMIHRAREAGLRFRRDAAAAAVDRLSNARVILEDAAGHDSLSRPYRLLGLGRPRKVGTTPTESVFWAVRNRCPDLPVWSHDERGAPHDKETEMSKETCP